MDVSQLPLNALRAFEASARLGSLTRAGLELRVTQTAVSHQVKLLEETLRVTLITRLPRGLALTDDGHALLPVLTDAFRRMSATLSQFEQFPGDIDDRCGRDVCDRLVAAATGDVQGAASVGRFAAQDQQ
jgi:DNA-binding transcriptional LysR family regulator